MSDCLLKMNFDEVNYYYKSPFALVDYSLMQSFSIIKSCVEIFVYYGITEFSAYDVKCFFEKLQLIQKKNGRIFIPSEKKIDGVLSCCLPNSENIISYNNGIYTVQSWNISGYEAEINLAHSLKRI